MQKFFFSCEREILSNCKMLHWACFYMAEAVGEEASNIVGIFFALPEWNSDSQRGDKN